MKVLMFTPQSRAALWVPLSPVTRGALFATSVQRNKLREKRNTPHSHFGFTQNSLSKEKQMKHLREVLSNSSFSLG